MCLCHQSISNGEFKIILYCSERSILIVKHIQSKPEQNREWNGEREREKEANIFCLFFLFNYLIIAILLFIMGTHTVFCVALRSIF